MEADHGLWSTSIDTRVPDLLMRTDLPPEFCCKGVICCTPPCRVPPDRWDNLENSNKNRSHFLSSMKVSLKEIRITIWTMRNIVRFPGWALTQIFRGWYRLRGPTKGTPGIDNGTHHEFVIVVAKSWLHMTHPKS